MSSSSRNDPQGWPALVGGGLINVAIGTYYAWSVFVPALEKEFGWTRTQTSRVPQIDMIVLSSMFVLAGYLTSRIGPRTVATIGGILFSLGLFLASYVQSLTGLYLTWGVLVGMGLGLAYSPPITVGAKWFPNHRGLVNGLAIAIFAAGSGIFGPAAGTMIEHIGWRETFQILAGTFFVFTMVGSYLMKDPPPGYVGPVSKSTGAGRARTHQIDTPTSRVVRDPVFIALWVAYALGTTSGTMVISQLVPFARLAGHAETAAFAIAIGALGSASGRFFSGWLSDHLGRLRTLRFVIFTSMLVTPALYIFRQEIIPFWLLLYLVYYCYGTQLSVYTALAGDFWGTKYLATNYGVLLVAWGFAGLMGPQLGAKVYESTHNYQYAFFGAAGFALASLVILSIVRTPHVETVAPAPAMAAGR